MSSFLEKLISGGAAIDNNAPPDSHGVVTRRIVKEYAAQPPEELGLTLSDDGEVINVSEKSLAQMANIPVHFMIFEVNNVFVGDSSTFFDNCRSQLNLTIKLQSVSGMSEIIAKILSCEEKYSTEELREHLKLDELLKTTPRFDFLSNDHPLFQRYTRRLKDKREANSLIKLYVQEAKEEERRSVLESLKRVREENTETPAPAKPKVEVNIAYPASSIDSGNSTAPFVDVHEPATYLFGKTNEGDKNQKSKETVSYDYAKQVEIAEAKTVDNALLEGGMTTQLEELLNLIGVKNHTKMKQNVSYVILPSEEYVLSSGERVVHALKKRIGPPPTPPQTSS